MGDDTFNFRISPYDVDLILPQVSQALEMRTELVSRKRYPGLWRLTDKINAKNHGRTRSRLRTRLMSIVCLVLGVFLFVPGAMEPQELFVPLLVGALAIGAGIGGFWRSRKHKKNPFDQSAKLLLEKQNTLSAEQSIVVSFSETGMSVSVSNDRTERVPYDSFACIMETPNVFLLFHDTRVTALQKFDLSGPVDAFRSFISERIPQYHSIT